MVAATNEKDRPFGLVMTGEAENWLPALERIVGPEVLAAYRVRGERELLEVVEAGLVDAAVLDDEDIGTNIRCLEVLRMIRRLNRALPVVVVTAHPDRRFLEHALRLAAFSVVGKPLQFESLLLQIHRMMVRLDRMLRQDSQTEREE